MKIFINSLVLFFLFFVVIQPVESAPNQKGSTDTVFSLDLDKDQKEDYQLILDGWVQQVQPGLYERTYTYADYKTYTYKKNNKLFKLMLVKMDNGDIIYFARNEVGKDDKPVQLKIKVNHSHNPIMRKVGKEYIDQLVWKNEIHHPVFVEDGNFHYRIGNVRTLEPLGYTVQRECTEVTKIIKTKKEYDSVSFQIQLGTQKGMVTETWGILSKSDLIDWNNDTLLGFVKRIEDQNTRLLRMDGIYTKAPYHDNMYNYQPSTPRSFYRNPANVDGLDYVNYLDHAGDFRYLQDLMIHFAYSSVNSQNEFGYWYTYPLSQWLKQDYHISYCYMDNRKNIDNVTFLNRFYQIKYEPRIQAALNRWDQYHMEYIQNQGISTGNKGKLIPDYVGDLNSLKSHISLNHQTANINYLLERYQITKNEQQKRLAEQLLEGISDTKEKWVKENHNLYYALMPDLTPHFAKDYNTLTLEDLMHTQRLLTKIYGKRNEDLQYLIDEKNNYLKKEKSPLT